MNSMPKVRVFSIYDLIDKTVNIRLLENRNDGLIVAIDIDTNILYVLEQIIYPNKKEKQHGRS